MKKLLVLIVLFVLPNMVFSQDWKDSLNVARKFYKEGKYKEALKYYKSADKLKPNSVDLSQEMAQAEFRADEYENASKNYDKAAENSKNSKQKASVMTNSGTAKMKTKDYAAAEENFKQALRLDPSNEKARQQLVEARKARKKQEEEQKKNNCKNPQDQKDQGEQQKQNQGGQQNKQDQKQGNSQNQQKGQQKPQDGQGDKNQKDQNGKGQNGKSKLGDKQTDRKLDELTRQEMGTKRRIEGSKGNGSGTAKKNW
jgi:tetratricopeptide (TPR) repeat protein